MISLGERLWSMIAGFNPLSFITGNLITIGAVAAVTTTVLMWRSDLIDKGDRRAVQRIEKQENKRAKVIRSAGSKSLDNSVRGRVSPYVID